MLGAAQYVQCHDERDCSAHRYDQIRSQAVSPAPQSRRRSIVGQGITPITFNNGTKTHSSIREVIMPPNTTTTNAFPSQQFHWKQRFNVSIYQDSGFFRVPKILQLLQWSSGFKHFRQAKTTALTASPSHSLARTTFRCGHNSNLYSGKVLPCWEF